MVSGRATVVIVQPFVLAILILALFIALITDIRSHKIPNWLTYPLIILAIISYSDVNGLQGLLFSAEGLGLGLAVLMPLYIVGGMGAGDVKLMAAVGAALGPVHLFYAFLCTAIAGGIYALILALVKTGLLKQLVSRVNAAFCTVAIERDLHSPRFPGEMIGVKLYFGVAISLGTLAYVGFEAYQGNIETGLGYFM